MRERERVRVCVWTNAWRFKRTKYEERCVESASKIYPRATNNMKWNMCCTPSPSNKNATKSFHTLWHVHVHVFAFAMIKVWCNEFINGLASAVDTHQESEQLLVACLFVWLSFVLIRFCFGVQCLQMHSCKLLTIHESSTVDECVRRCWRWQRRQIRWCTFKNESVCFRTTLFATRSPNGNVTYCRAFSLLHHMLD